LQNRQTTCAMLNPVSFDVHRRRAVYSCFLMQR
jgi:hypothetical protein